MTFDRAANLRLQFPWIRGRTKMAGRLARLDVFRVLLLEDGLQSRECLGCNCLFDSRQNSGVTPLQFGEADFGGLTLFLAVPLVLVRGPERTNPGQRQVRVG